MSSTKGSFSVITFGCKANQFDTAQIILQIENEGFFYTEKIEDADFIIINSCTVTGKSDYKCRQTARKWKRAFPSKKIVLTGCYAQRIKAESFPIDEIDEIVAREDSEKILNAFQRWTKKEQIENKITDDFAAPVIFPGMTRALVKIQDGCDQRCSYCIVPFVRGASRSVPEEKIIEGILTLEEAGFKEAVLTGIHIGKWGYDLGESKNLLSLLQILTLKTKIRIRLSSLEPNELSQELIDFIRYNPAVRPHFHIPLQSGSSDVLRDMNRHYNTATYENLILSISEAFDYPGIGTDVIVGFPTETDKYFQQTVDLIEKLPFSYLHIFPYSKRPGTQSSNIKSVIGDNIKTERARLLRSIGAAKKKNFAESQVGTIREALTLEAAGSGNKIRALSDNYIRLEISGKVSSNSIIKVKILKYANGITSAEAVKETD